MVISSILVYTQTITWKPLITGAGGWVTGMDIHPSGNPIYIRVDVGSAYRYDPATNTWINIVTANTLPATEVYWNNYHGVRQVLFDASAGLQNGRIRTATIYATVDSVGLFQFVDAGATWTNVSSGNFPTNPIFLDANIDEQGLLYVLGYDANTNASFGIYRYNGQTWQTISNTSEVINMAIVAPLTAGAYPTIFIQGRVNSVMAIGCQEMKGLLGSVWAPILWGFMMLQRC